MSELSELIKINRNIEKQNDEIIRLLKKIAGESENTVEMEFVRMGDVSPEDITIAHEDLFRTQPDVGEVYFLEGKNVFRLSVKNNETIVDNLVGSTQPDDFALQELIANESIRLNQPTKPSTVILSMEQSTNLAESLRICIDQGAKYVYLPWSSMTQLIGAPDVLMTLLKLDFYRTEEELINKVFMVGD